jgi:hypothetical protein
MNSTVSTHYPGESFYDANYAKQAGRPIEVMKPVERIPSIDVLRGFA